jgi:glycosyltransferase involved in cell wall biosynthesis
MPRRSRKAGGGEAPRIVFLNRFFHPDHSATSQMLTDLAVHLADGGADVRVIASRQRYDDPDSDLAARDTWRGVVIRRVATTRFGRHSAAGRALDYLSFHVAAAAALIGIAGRGDIVVAKSDPPMLSVLAWVLAPLRGFKRVNWLQDLYPEIARELGVGAATGVPGQILIAIRNASLRRAAMNITVGEAMAERLHSHGISRENLAVVPNWADDTTIVPSDPADNPLRRDWSLDGKFIVAYSGNLGHAHDVETMLDAAERLRARSDIVFLFIGGGQRRIALAAATEARRLGNIVFKPYQPRDQLHRSLGVADLHWLSLRIELEGLVVPSKFYGIAAAGRPILVIAAPEGELSRLVARHDCGFAVAPGHGGELADLIARLAADPGRCRALGANARRMLDMHFTQAAALERWRAILASVAENDHAAVAATATSRAN